MKKIAIIALVALFCAAPLSLVHAKVQSANSLARAIFAKHDASGRLKWTKIKKLGDVRVGKSIYSIYNLSFVNYNTASLHGMQQVSIIKNDRIFVGSYIDVAEPAVAIRGRIVSMKQQVFGGKASPQTYFRIGLNGPPRKKVLLAGGFHDLENSI